MRTGVTTRRAIAGLVLAILGALAAGPGAGAVARAGAQEPDGPVAPSTSVATSTTVTPETAPGTAPIITTTLPVSEGDLGRIIPLPNSGAEPETPGDRGGWQQVGLFVLVCVVILAMGAFVWWRSRIARERRVSEGHDPVAMAREQGGDVRKPRPPGIVD